ncbi:23S rRNA (uracil(1939)-C(5))-methyltransferase RlmD [Ornithobacterium rhinotracheale]|uniref:23S rRNA (uracil(1939)-C(5))-methyltransferase RlmD n=1 Tax=Ornithobacterium rhinotracheale TaxID=28251 RepID=UPI0039FD9F4C
MAKKERKPLILENIYLETAGAKGASIGKAPDGKTIFVRNAVPGDTVDVRILKKKRRYMEGTAVFVQEYSEFRTEPECEHFGVCGGCKWQNMKYVAQLHYKEKEVYDHLTRIGGIEIDGGAQKILGSKEKYFYRNKLEFSFSNQRWITEDEIAQNKEITDRNALGFHIPGMWSKILDVKKCWLQRDPSNAIRLAIKDYAEKHNLAFFDPVKQEGFLRTLMIRTTTTGEVMVLIQFFEENKSERENLLNHILEQFPSITSLLYAINPKGNDSVYDLDIKTFAGQDFITEKMEDLHFKIGPKSFYQTNPEQTYELYKVARDFAGLTGEELVYDLYTGTGTIAQFVSKKAKKVVGIESVPEAIAAAKENAAANGIENCTFYCGDMKDVFTDEFVTQNGTPDIIITDPPRDGMHPKVVENILRIAPKRVVYVSCNSATQARDLALMKEQYKVVKIQPVDMFPQTYHVENVVLLEKI